MAQVMSNILRFSASLQRQQEGQSSLYPLLALVKAQQRLAGRKTLVYFAEGLQVPKNLDEVFKTAISEANRANVTVYAVDARGLNSSRDSEAARQQLLDAARVSAAQMAKRGAGAVTVDEVMIAENAEESLRANVQSTMAELAQSTGGFLTSPTPTTSRCRCSASRPTSAATTRRPTCRRCRSSTASSGRSPCGSRAPA
jgi:hypothetical protein